LNNSIKFAKFGGEILLKSKFSRKYHGLISISVRDSGVGIHLQKLKILEENLNHESESGESLGSFVNNRSSIMPGLGLKIANKICSGLVHNYQL
jgi:signal transduction histidine kinase